MENFEILACYPNKPRPDGYKDMIFSEKILMRYKRSEVKIPVCFAPAIFEDIERIQNFNVNEDDIFLCGFMRSGTTFTQEMLWLIAHDFDFDKANKVDVYDRAQYFEYFTSICTQKNQPIDYFEHIERPRVFKTHLPVHLLPPQVWTKNPKMIFISRDVKDVAVSCYHLRKTIFRENVDSIEEHFEDFMNDRLWFAPYREYLKSYLNLKDNPNILFLTYESVVGDWEGSIRKVAKFLDKELTDENVQKLIAHLDFKAMKKNPQTNLTQFMELLNEKAGHDVPTDTFIRKGVAGGYVDEMSPDYIKKFDEWFAEEPKEY